jgi:hypothetical protein
MNEFEFQGLCTALQSTFGKQIPKSSKDRTWERVQNIPGKHVKSIISRIEDTRDTLPQNLGKAILEAWTAIDGSAGQETVRAHCTHCDGDGSIMCYRKDPKTGEIHTSVAFCATCRPGTDYSATRDQLRTAGFMVCPTSDKEAQHRWWFAYLKHQSKLRTAVKAGNLVPGNLLRDFDAQVRAAELTPDELGLDPPKRQQPKLYGEQRL